MAGRNACPTVILLVTLWGGLAFAQTQPTTEPAAQPTTQPLLEVAATTMPATQPTTGPSTQPVADSQDRPRSSRNSRAPKLSAMPNDYNVLTSRSVFMKGRVPTPRPPESERPDRPSQPSAAVRAEQTMVFNGVTSVDGEGYAIFEDTTAGKISGFRVGDSIANGKIKSITLNGLNYETNAGRIIHVSIGQTLDGNAPPDISTRAIVTDPGAAPPATLPAGENDVAARMRAARLREQQQLQGK